MAANHTRSQVRASQEKVTIVSQSWPKVCGSMCVTRSIGFAIK